MSQLEPAMLLLCLSLAAAAVEAAEPAPDGWQSFAVRDEIAPSFQVIRERKGYALCLAGRGAESVDGRWQRTVPAEAGKHYAFSAFYQATSVPEPARSILARVFWLDAAGKQIGQAEYPVPDLRPAEGDRQALRGVYLAPEKTAQARLELHLRWAPQGEVVWRDAALVECASPAPRKVRLAAVNHRPRGAVTIQGNLQQFVPLIEDAARQKADIVCLGEGITVAGLGRKYADVAETVPGPTTQFLGEQAAKHRLYLVAGLYELDGKVLYNTSVLIGRDGKLAGKYRKVCLPREEIDGGITPGKEYPVFDTDFGRVGILICWDLSYPEVARELSARGAEVLLMPIWGGNETLARARAIENQVYLVASGYDFRTAIYDRTGKPVAEATADPQVIVTEVDLSETTLWPWLGDWRSRIWREGPERR